MEFSFSPCTVFCLQLLELERGENKRLLQQLAEKDCRIVELEKEVADLNKASLSSIFAQ